MSRRLHRLRTSAGLLLAALSLAAGCAGPSAAPAEGSESADPATLLEAATPRPANSTEGAAPPAPPGEELAAVVDVVWRSGTSPIYYHLAGCSRLNQASQLPLANAQRHLLPCDLCDPPR